MNWLNTLFILALAYISIFLEGSVDLFRHWLGAQITLLPALMVYASLTSGIGTVALLAVCGGLGRDSISEDPLGAGVLPLFLIGFVILWKRDLMLREQRLVQVALGLAAGAFFPLATLFLLLNVGRSPAPDWMWLWQWAVGTLAGGACAPLFFALFGRLRGALEYPERTQTSFREDREIKRGRM
jgi:hypothetical protein